MTPREPRLIEPALLPLLRLAAFEELTPTAGLDLDVVLAGRGPDPPPRAVPLGVAHAFDLVEPGHGVAHVLRVGQRFLPLLRERERAVGQVVLLRRGQHAARRPRPRARPGTAPAALRGAGLLEVLSSGLLLLG